MNLTYERFQHVWTLRFELLDRTRHINPLIILQIIDENTQSTKDGAVGATAMAMDGYPRVRLLIGQTLHLVDEANE